MKCGSHSGICAMRLACLNECELTKPRCVPVFTGMGVDTFWKNKAAELVPPAPALPIGSQARKDTPIYSGVLAYFPRALAYVAQVSKAGNDKHNPGEPLHWSKDKSNDHADCAARHLIEQGTVDREDNLRHSGKLAWRALALLETELEEAARTDNVSAVSQRK